MSDPISTKLLEIAFEQAPFPTAVLDPQGQFTRTNNAMSRLAGYSVEELLASSLTSLCHPDDHELALRLLEFAPTAVPVEHRIVRRDGGVVWMRTSTSVMHDEAGAPNAIVLQCEDITDRRLDEERLTFLALHDSLTGLPNRVLLKDRIAHALDGTDEARSRLCVMMVDIDRFKLLNDSLGHRIGDRILVEVADRLEDLVRQGDTVARLSGDEFGLLCEDVGQNNVIALAERVGESLAAPFSVDGAEFAMTVSVGVAPGAPHLAPSDLLRHSDLALHRAKELGGARVVSFDQSLQRESVKRIETERDLRRALDSHELALHYQPLVRLSTRETVGAEALIRWQHPELGLLFPGDFIPLAEQTGQVLPVGAWVIEEACRQIQAWRAVGLIDESFHIAVNVSGKQLADRSFPEFVSKALERHNVEPGALCLEMTESVLVEDTGSTARSVHELESLGVSLAIDDFGTGYSALGNLKRFAFDQLKIDKSFVDGLVLEHADSAIVAAVIGIANALGLELVAEGVELPEQAAALGALGVDLVQGFLFSPAVSAFEFGETLRNP